VIKDDMIIHAGIPAKAVYAALGKLLSEADGSTVTWGMARIQPGHPLELSLEATTTTEIQAAKRRLEQLSTRQLQFKPLLELKKE